MNFNLKSAYEDIFSTNKILYEMYEVQKSEIIYYIIKQSYISK